MSLSVARTLDLMQGTCSTDPGRRRQCEATLVHDISSGTAGFASMLLTIGLSDGVDPYYRQLAFVLLRRLVKEAWDNVTDSEKDSLRRTIPRGLYVSAHPRVAASTAAVIAEIAESDFPHAWSTLLDDLCSAIDSNAAGDPVVTYACVKCAQLITEDIDDSELAPLLPLAHLMTRVLRHANFAANVRCRAMRALRNLVYGAGHANDQCEEVQALLSIIAPHVEYVAQYALDDSDDTSHAVFVRWEALDMLRCIISVFPTQSLNIVRGIVSRLLLTLCQALPSLMERMHSSDSWVEVDYTSDGEEVSDEVVIYRRLELLHSLLTSRKRLVAEVWSVVGNDTSKLVGILLQFASLPASTLATWRTDVNQFLVDLDMIEEGDAGEVRGLTLELLREISKRKGDIVVRKVIETMTVFDSAPAWEVALATMSHVLSGRGSSCLRSYETAVTEILQLLFHANPRLTGDICDAHGLLTASMRFMHKILDMDNDSDGAVLSGEQRALLVQYICEFTRRVTSTFRDATSGGQPLPPLYVVAVTLRSFFVSQCVFGTSRECRDCYDMLLGLLNNGADVHVDFLTLVLDAFLYILGKHKMWHDSLPLSEAPRAILQSWLLHPSKSTADVYVNIMQELVQIPATIGSYINYVIPFAKTILEGTECVPLGFTTNVVSLVTVIARHSPEEIRRRLVETFFPLVCTFILVSDDADAVQAGCLCLACFIFLSASYLGSICLVMMRSVLERRLPGVDEHPEPIPALQVLFQTLSSLFAEDRGDSEKLYAGRVVHEVIRDLRDSLSVNDILLMLDFVVQVATKTPNGIVAQEMTVCIARVYLLCPQDLVSFLVSRKLCRDILQRWVEQHPDIYGNGARCVSSLALLNMLRTRDPRLHDVTVSFLPIDTPQRSTRSNTREVDIPLEAALFLVLGKTLLRLYNEVDEANGPRAGSSQSPNCDEEGDWCSDMESEDSKSSGGCVYLSDLLEGDDEDKLELVDRPLLSTAASPLGDGDDDLHNMPAISKQQLVSEMRCVLKSLATECGAMVLPFVTSSERNQLYSLLSN